MRYNFCRRVLRLGVLTAGCLTFLLRVSGQNNLPDNIEEADCITDVVEQPWDIVQGNSSPLLSHMYAQPYIGDIDNDGQSEIVTVGYFDSPNLSSSIIIYGVNLQLKYTINTG
ncbi:MAG: hypothetical protein IKQ52_00030, partial [Bacteroidales bacterium]|nr:hypothetical protein [Bacteroidales bacterium]